MAILNSFGCEATIGLSGGLCEWSLLSTIRWKFNPRSVTSMITISSFSIQDSHSLETRHFKSDQRLRFQLYPKLFSVISQFNKRIQKEGLGVQTWTWGGKKLLCETLCWQAGLRVQCPNVRAGNLRCIWSP